MRESQGEGVELFALRSFKAHPIEAVTRRIESEDRGNYHALDVLFIEELISLDVSSTQSSCVNYAAGFSSGHAGKGAMLVLHWRLNVVNG